MQYKLGVVDGLKRKKRHGKSIREQRLKMNGKESSPLNNYQTEIDSYYGNERIGGGATISLINEDSARQFIPSQF